MGSMQSTGSMKVSLLDLMTALIKGGKLDTSSLSSESGAQVASLILENREFVMILTTFIAVLIGCAIVLVSRRSSSASQPPRLVMPPKPLVEKELDLDVDDGKKKVTIFFGTQTGTVEGFAKALAEKAKARYEKANFRVLDLDDYAAEDEEYEEKFKKESLALFFLDTYGDGEPTDNATRFYKWFMEGKERNDMFKDLKYGVFGLGNRQYEHFNKIAKEVDGMLADQGGQRIIPVGLGDDDKCIEDDFTAWRESLWPELYQLLRDEDDVVATPYTAAVLEYRVVFYDPADAPLEDNNWSNANGHAIYDAQHGPMLL